MLDSAFERLKREVGRSEHYQQLIRETQAALTLSNRELEEFAFTVAHDLRAPLRSIGGFSKVLLEDHSSNLNGEGKDCLERVNAAALRMNKLIDDILTLSRISRIELNREDFDLSSMVQVIVDEIRQREPQREVDFIIQDGVKVNGAPRLIQTVLENLLGNSWKFTARHDTARIEFGVVERDGEKVFFVRDDGAGFDMAHADKLFGVFQRLHGAQEFSGTGVGLASVRRIVQRHGGRIWAEGEVEKGATFFFTF